MNPSDVAKESGRTFYGELDTIQTSYERALVVLDGTDKILDDTNRKVDAIVEAQRCIGASIEELESKVKPFIGLFREPATEGEP